MGLDQAQLSALGVVLSACAEECLRSPLGNLLEGHLKVVAADALLRAGYSIMESANAKGQGRVLSLKDGRVGSEVESRPTIPAHSDSTRTRMSPDLRIWRPCRLVLELQVRSTFGSQSALFSENLFDDVRRVSMSAVDAFVLAADRELYDALRGIKQDARGRKSKHGDLFVHLLPPSASLARCADSLAWPWSKHDPFEVSGALLGTSFGLERCIVGVRAV